GEVRHDADARLNARRIVQLKRRDLERYPLWRRRLERELRERRADVAGGHRAMAPRGQDVRGEGGGGRLAVGAGDRGVAEVGQEAERDLHLAHDLDAPGARGGERWRGRRYTWTRNHQRRALDSLQIVTTHIHRDSLFREGSGGELERGRRLAVGGVHLGAGA